jgi:hypothetical protein
MRKLVLARIESPIKDFLRSDPAVVAYAERMRTRFFPELADQHSLKRAMTIVEAPPARGAVREVEQREKLERLRLEMTASHSRHFDGP